MRTWIWRLLWSSAALFAVITVVMLVVTERRTVAECDPASPCDIHGYFPAFYVGVGVVLTGVSLASCGFSWARSEAGPLLGLLSSILVVGFVAGGDVIPSWLTVLTCAVGGWLLILSIAGLTLLRADYSRAD